MRIQDSAREMKTCGDAAVGTCKAIEFLYRAGGWQDLHADALGLETGNEVRIGFHHSGIACSDNQFVGGCFDNGLDILKDQAMPALAPPRVDDCPIRQNYQVFPEFPASDRHAAKRI